MPYSTGKTYSSTRHATTGLEEDAHIVTIEPPREPPKKATAKGQWRKRSTTSKSQPEKKPAASKSQSSRRQLPVASHPAKNPSSAMHSSPKDYVTGKSPLKQKASTARDQPTKSNVTLDTHPILGYLTISGQPNLSPEYTAEALRLPCDGSRVRIVNIPLTEVGGDDKSLKKWLDKEIWLGHFPDMDTLTRSSIFSWDHRQLLSIPADKLGGSFDTKFLIYVCYERKAKLTKNEYLEKLSGVHMYGDSFLFKVHCFKDYGRPDFLHMGKEDLVEGLEDGGATEQILRKLLGPRE